MFRILFISLVLALLSTRAFCQRDSVSQDPVDFVGGRGSINSFLAENVRYPIALAEECVQGLVIMKFIIKQDGTVDSIAAIHSPHPGLTSEIERVILLMRWKWNNSASNGKENRIYMTLPFSFALENSGCPTVGNLYADGKKLFDKKNYKDALVRFQSAFAVDCRDVKNNFMLAECYKRLNRTADICQLIERLRQIYISRPEFQGSLATLREYYGTDCGE